MTAVAEGKRDASPPGPLRSVLAPNPSPMTGPGTTTWILGEGEVAVIDPGPDDPAHLQAILAALAPGERIGAILVTHAHLDHSAAVPALAAMTGAPVSGAGPAGSGRSAAMRALAEALPATGGEGLDRNYRPDRLLTGGEILALGNLHLQVVATPGHMAEHLAFGWGDHLFCGDLVMAWAPSLVSPPDGEMAAYLDSLAQVSAGGWSHLLPAHGPVIADPARRIAELIAHRRGREAQVLAALDAGPAPLAEVTTRVYPDLSGPLLRAATRNALAHLIDLISKNQVVATGWPGPFPVFRHA